MSLVLQLDREGLPAPEGDVPRSTYVRAVSSSTIDAVGFTVVKTQAELQIPIGRPLLIREYIYLYGAVSPKDGICVYLIMPTSNTACFQAFLDVLARKFRRQDILLVLDGAPNHRCGELALPDNITLLYLPPYSPELNPKENLWDEIREKIFKNYALKSIDAVRAKLKQAILYIERNPKLVRSITSFPYIAKSL